MSILNRLLGRKGEERKFYRDTLKLGYSEWGGSTFVKIDGQGNVVESDNPIRGKEGEVFWIGLPWLWEKRPIHRISFSLPGRVDGYELKVKLTLTIVFTSKQFDLQELYDKMTKRGFGHIDDWLKALYINAAQEDKGVQKAFKRYAKHGRPGVFFEELSQALRQLTFRGSVLSNIKQVKARAHMDIVAETLQATYNDA